MTKRGQPRRRRAWGRLTTALVCAVASFAMVTAAVAARGIDLRPDRNTDLISLVRQRATLNTEATRQIAALRADIDRLSRAVAPRPEIDRDVAVAEVAAGLQAVHGPGVTVTLTDAPVDTNPGGVDGDLLVVHQQDIQGFANVLWSGGAEALTIQGQRVTSRTAIKCVGNTVVLHGIPYAPPYAIAAIGDQAKLEAALASSRFVEIYRQYVTAYGLGYQQSRAADVRAPAYTGPLDVQYAKVRR